MSAYENIIDRETVKYEKERISSSIVAGAEIHTSANFFDEQLRKQMDAYIYSRMSDRQSCVVSVGRPTFLDWFLRRPRKATVEVSIKKVLVNPPKTDKHEIVMFSLEQV